MGPVANIFCLKTATKVAKRDDERRVRHSRNSFADNRAKLAGQDRDFSHGKVVHLGFGEGRFSIQRGGSALQREWPRVGAFLPVTVACNERLLRVESRPRTG